MLFESAVDHILLPDSFAMLDYIIPCGRADFSLASAVFYHGKTPRTLRKSMFVNSINSVLGL
jgi:hypothetical protein